MIGTLAPGQTKTFQVHTTAKVLTVDNTNDQLTIGKVEQHVSIQAGQTQTAQITCGPDGIMSDGSVRVDSVDQGTGDLNSVEVNKLKSISESTYEATVTNHSTGQAQVKLFGVCLPKKTTGGHELLVSAPVTQTVVLNQGVHTVNLTCGAGYTPIAPGLQVTGGRAYVIASAPNGPTGRKVTLRIDQNNTTAEVSIRCLSNKTSAVNGASTELQFTPITKSIQVGADQTATEQLTCGENAKGIVAGWEYDDELVQLGNDPQPKTRVFKIWNPTHHPLNATLYLLCLEVRTGTPGGGNEYVNTANGQLEHEPRPREPCSPMTPRSRSAGNGPTPVRPARPAATGSTGPTGSSGTSSISAFGASDHRTQPAGEAEQGRQGQAHGDLGQEVHGRQQDLPQGQHPRQGHLRRRCRQGEGQQVGSKGDQGRQDQAGQDHHHVQRKEEVRDSAPQARLVVKDSRLLQAPARSADRGFPSGPDAGG